MSLRVRQCNNVVFQSSGCALLSSTEHTPYLHRSQPATSWSCGSCSTAKTAKWTICMQMRRCIFEVPYLLHAIDSTGGSTSMQNAVITVIFISCLLTLISNRHWWTCLSVLTVSRTFAHIRVNKCTPACKLCQHMHIGTAIVRRTTASHHVSL